MTNAPLLDRILAFLERIGIRVDLAAVDPSTLLPAMTIRDGALVVDPDRLTLPGDVLHEAGHIAVTDPAARPTLCEVPSDPGEEMAAIAWSYAAALEIGLDPAIVFHDEGYRGCGAHLAAQFARGEYIAVPLLQWFGMTLDEKNASERDERPYPHMQRWLR